MQNRWNLQWDSSDCVESAYQSSLKVLSTILIKHKHNQLTSFMNGRQPFKVIGGNSYDRVAIMYHRLCDKWNGIASVSAK